jgi:hypothetical protein
MCSVQEPRGFWTLPIACCSGRHTKFPKLHVSIHSSPENLNKISLRNFVLLYELLGTLSIPEVASLEELRQTHFRRQLQHEPCKHQYIHTYIYIYFPPDMAAYYFCLSSSDREVSAIILPSL